MHEAVFFPVPHKVLENAGTTLVGCAESVTVTLSVLDGAQFSVHTFSANVPDFPS